MKPTGLLRSKSTKTWTNPTIQGYAETRTRTRKIVEQEANHFAACVHGRPSVILEWINRNGFDVIRLRRYLDCSYATALIQLGHVLSTSVFADSDERIPIIGILYERPTWKPSRSGRLPQLRLRYFIKTPGFPFILKKTEVDRLYIRQVNAVCRLKTLARRAEENLFLEEVELIRAGDFAVPVHILIQPIRWRSICHKPVKVLIQIMPSKFRSLHKVADDLRVEPSPLPALEE